MISNNRHPEPGRSSWPQGIARRSSRAIAVCARSARAIHSEALSFVPRSALLEQARRLGLTAGKMLVADSIDELTLAFDLCLYTAAPGRSRGIDRYARSAGVAPDRMRT